MIFYHLTRPDLGFEHFHLPRTTITLVNVNVNVNVTLNLAMDPESNPRTPHTTWIISCHKKVYSDYQSGQINNETNNTITTDDKSSIPPLRCVPKSSDSDNDNDSTSYDGVERKHTPTVTNASKRMIIWINRSFLPIKPMTIDFVSLY